MKYKYTVNNGIDEPFIMVLANKSGEIMDKITDQIIGNSDTVMLIITREDGGQDVQ